jgi:hypothetical protein
VEPAAQGGRSGEAVGIFDHRRRLLPGTTLHKAASQRLAAGDQAVMAVGWRELRQESEGLVARPAPAASNRNPVVVLVVSLFAVAAMADNRITLTTWAEPQDDLTGDYGPIRRWRGRLLPGIFTATGSMMTARAGPGQCRAVRPFYRYIRRYRQHDRPAAGTLQRCSRTVGS